MSTLYGHRPGRIESDLAVREMSQLQTRSRFGGAGGVTPQPHEQRKIEKLLLKLANSIALPVVFATRRSVSCW